MTCIPITNIEQLCKVVKEKNALRALGEEFVVVSCHSWFDVNLETVTASRSVQKRFIYVYCAPICLVASRTAL